MAIRLTKTLLNAIDHALTAALAGEGFDGGDFTGLNRDHFERASSWVSAQLRRRSSEVVAPEMLQAAREAAPVLERYLNSIGLAHDDEGERVLYALKDAIAEAEKHNPT